MADITSIVLPTDLNTQGLSMSDGRQLKSYLYQLTEQLRYVLSNLDSENMSTAYNQTVRARAEQLAQKSQDIQTQMQTVHQLAAQTDEALVKMQEKTKKWARPTEDGLEIGAGTTRTGCAYTLNLEQEKTSIARKDGVGISLGKTVDQEDRFDVGLPADFRCGAEVQGGLCVIGGLQVDGVKMALQEGTLVCAKDVLKETENVAVKCGRLVMARLKGTFCPSQAGAPCCVASLRSGWFSKQYPAMVSAWQNDMPCRGYVTKQGDIYVIPVQAGENQVEVSVMGIV